MTKTERDPFGLMEEQFSKHAFETLRQVGYRLNDEHDLTLGFMAYNAAMLVQMELWKTPQKPETRYAKAGRNDPCPCGSGRKFKKCCLDKSQSSSSRSSQVPLSPLPDEAIIPNFTDHSCVDRCQETLWRLFKTDPELNKIRFSPLKTASFLEKALKGFKSTDEDELNQYIDEVAWRYVQEVEGKELIKQLSGKLAESASRVGNNADELRSIVFGVALACMVKDGSPDPHPLACMVFRLTMSELVGEFQSRDELIRLLGEPEDVRERLMRGDRTLKEDIERAMASVDPEKIENLKEIATRYHAELMEIIKKGKFPVALPFATVLPLILRMIPMMERGESPSDEKLQELLTELVENLDPEDLRLYGQLLDSWLGSDDKSDPDLTAQVGMIRSRAALGDLYPFDWPLLVSSLRGPKFSMAKEEKKILTSHKQNFTPAFLEQYGSFLLESGFPSLARRTWNLCGLLGQLPASVAEKIEALDRQKEG